MSTSIPGFVSIPEAARIIGVTDSLVRRWVREGRLPFHQVGQRSRIIPVRAVQKFKQTERKPGPRKA